MSDEFEITWEAEDGYCGGSRPHHTSISSDDLEDDFDEKTIRAMFYDLIQNDFEQRVSWTSEDEEDFVVWAMEQIAKKKQEEGEQ